MPNETVTLVLPSGEPVDFIVPSGLSDNQVRAFVMSKRPELFTNPGQSQQAAPGNGLATEATGIGPNPSFFSRLATAAQSGGPVGIGQELASSMLSPLLQSKAKVPGTGVSVGQATQNAQQLTGLAATEASTLAGPEFSEEAGAALSGKLLKSEAASKLANIKNIAGNTPVNTAHFGDTALQLWAEKQAGAQLPQAVSKLVNRITQPGAEPLTYAEAKSFQSNISALSANERMAIKPNTSRLLGQLNQQLKDSLEEASQMGGFQPGTFSGAMKQYSQAAGRQEMLEHIKELALKTVPKAAIGGAAGVGGATAIYEIYRALTGK